jgi:hypothetical protein
LSRLELSSDLLKPSFLKLKYESWRLVKVRKNFESPRGQRSVCSLQRKRRTHEQKIDFFAITACDDDEQGLVQTKTVNFSVDRLSRQLLYRHLCSAHGPSISSFYNLEISLGCALNFATSISLVVERKHSF